MKRKQAKRIYVRSPRKPRDGMGRKLKAKVLADRAVRALKPHEQEICVAAAKRAAETIVTGMGSNDGLVSAFSDAIRMGVNEGLARIDFGVIMARAIDGEAARRLDQYLRGLHLPGLHKNAGSQSAS